MLVLRAHSAPTPASTPGVTDDARLPRVQAFAPCDAFGLRVARYLPSFKVAGQARLLLKRFGAAETAITVGQLAQAIEAAETIEETHQFEASAAALYFRAWAGRDRSAPPLPPGTAGGYPPLGGPLRAGASSLPARPAPASLSGR